MFNSSLTKIYAENGDLDCSIHAYAQSFSVMEQIFLYPEAQYFSVCHQEKYNDRQHFEDLADGNTLIQGTFEAVWKHVLYIAICGHN